MAWVYGIMGFTGFQLNSQTAPSGHSPWAWVSTTPCTPDEDRGGGGEEPRGSPEEWAFASPHSRPSHGRCSCHNRRGLFRVEPLPLVPLQLFGQAFVVAITLALLASVLLSHDLPNLMKWEQKSLGSLA